jgi:two-component system response regulator ResD
VGDDAVKPLVLVVEDDANIRRLARIGVERNGFAVDDVADGRTAIARLDDASRRYVAVTVDLGLPDMPGIDVVEHARRVRPELAIVVCSGSQPPPSVPSIVVLPKPYTPKDLGAAVRDAVKAAGGA